MKVQSAAVFLTKKTQFMGQVVIATYLYSAFYFVSFSFEDARRFPVLTFTSGLTNSMRGAAFLSGVQNGIVIDIGGTTTHVGSVKDGFPKHLSAKVVVFWYFVWPLSFVIAIRP